jgi:hypothetical protein
MYTQVFAARAGAWQQHARDYERGAQSEVRKHADGFILSDKQTDEHFQLPTEARFVMAH